MNCQAIQNQILALPDPRELPSALREHVLACATCQAWARQAARLEALLEQLPVPPAPEQKKESLIGDLMQADPVILPMPTPASRPGYGLVAVKFLARNAAYVGGLAAAVFVAVGIYVFWPGKTDQQTAQPTQKHPLLQKMLKRDMELARADSSAAKLEVLNGMADDLSSETRGMARIASGSEMKQMADWYETVVKGGMVSQAEKFPTSTLTATEKAEKAKLLESLAAKLAADAVETEKLAGEVPPDAQPALKRMADTAREGEKSLRAQARGGK